MVKKTLIVLLIAFLAVVFWFAFAIWTGLYSIYTYPPSKDYPDGATLIVSREEGEPMFNSPAYKPPPRKTPPTQGLKFDTPFKLKRPISIRTILELPYIEWAYEKSLESPPPENLPD